MVEQGLLPRLGLAMLVASCARFVVAQSPSTPPAPAPQPVPNEASVAPVLVIANGKQFEPPEWHLSWTWTGEGDAKVFHPFIRYHMRSDAGEWKSVDELYPRASFRGSHHDSNGSCSGDPYWRVGSGSPIDFVGDVADWRVVGYPGIYKAEAHLRGFGNVWSNEFSITGADSSGQDLLAAQAATRSKLWIAFQESMSCVLSPGYGLSEARHQFHESLMASLPQAKPRGLFEESPLFLLGMRPPWEELRAADVLPASLRDRIELLRLLGVGGRVRYQAPAGSVAAAEAADWASRIAALAHKPGHVGRVARYQWLLYAKQANLGGCDLQFAAAADDPIMRGVAASCVVGVDEIGVLPGWRRMQTRGLSRPGPDSEVPTGPDRGPGR